MTLQFEWGISTTPSLSTLNRRSLTMIANQLKLVILLAVVQGGHLEDVPGGGIVADCFMEAESGMSTVPIAGTVTFIQENVPGGNVTVDIDLRGFNTSDNITHHGFHIHSRGDLANECRNTGGHFNPTGDIHGSPRDSTRHTGDLGNIIEDADGRVISTMTDDVIQLAGANSIVGRAVVVHAGEDDLGDGGHVDSNTTGNAGGRLGCCVITPRDVREIHAECNIESNSGNPSESIQGIVMFQQMSASDVTQMKLRLTGFNTDDNHTQHGFHIHEFGQLGNQCKDAGGHFNPFGRLHGSPRNNKTSRHVGDLGNIKEDERGDVIVTLTDGEVSLRGRYSVIGKAVVVHERADDMGRGGTDASRSTGDAGGRIGCCIITEATVNQGSSPGINSLLVVIIAWMVMCTI